MTETRRVNSPGVECQIDVSQVTFIRMEYPLAVTGFKLQIIQIMMGIPPLAVSQIFLYALSSTPLQVVLCTCN